MTKPWAVLVAGALVLTACGRATDSDDGYPPHEGITATVFWAGEPPTSDNDEIANDESYWDGDWESHFGGFDDPDHRTVDGSAPAAFTPKENAFYFALPYGEINDDDSVKTTVDDVPWYEGQHVDRAHSILKNRWIEVRKDGRTVYAQWQDVGPFNEDDPDYVFGAAAPHEQRSGLDLSPAAASVIGLDGKDTVSWRFVAADAVPDGPWKKTVTTRGGIPESD
ncbi:MAG TPA: hypothetical protein VGP36_24810 [Mycobacteriales bacterium]|jgi:hypothetical protein|nr:hypothetical protein [Mycobacteriales bacterium]